MASWDFDYDQGADREMRRYADECMAPLYAAMKKKDSFIASLKNRIEQLEMIVQRREAEIDALKETP
jgi:CII-binding regulator of phage lambda lysogenization HflD